MIDETRTGRPAVICHMLSSLDGKISGRFLSVPETAPALQEFARLRGARRCTATLYGTTTMAESYADGLAPRLPDEPQPLARTDWLPRRETEQLVISVDPNGVLAWHSPVLEKPGRPPAQVVEVLTQQVPDAYLHYLRRLGISYLFAGQDHLDCRLLLQKLRALCGVERLMLSGGGVINGVFLQSGLVDELSLVLAPAVEGDPDAVSLFEPSVLAPGTAPAALRLLDSQPLSGGALWLRYEVTAG